MACQSLRFYRKLTPLTERGSGSVTKKKHKSSIADSGFPLEVCELNKMATYSSGTAVKEESKEAAFEAFRAKFTRNG